MKSFILFYSAVIIVSFCVMVVPIFIVTIFNPSDCCLLKRSKVPSSCVFCDQTTGGQCFRNLNPVAWGVKSHEILWPLFKLKFGNCWLTSKCCGSSSKKFNSGFRFPFQSLQFQFHFQFHQFQLQLKFQNWNWNWAAITIPELNWLQPCHLPPQYSTHIIMLQ